MSTNERVRQKLSKEHDPDEVAIWHIRGEDPDCDARGRPRKPSLAYVKGRYEHVLEYALNIPEFVTWGSGGSIEPIDVMDIDADSMQKITAARNRIRQLDDELHNAKEALKRLENTQ